MQQNNILNNYPTKQYWEPYKRFPNIFANIILLALSILYNSCSDKTEGFGKYYEGKFTDEVTLVSGQDSTNIILEQLGMTSKIKEDVPFSIEEKPNLQDSIKLKLFVSFGSYNQNPTVIKETNQFDDSIYVWYSTRHKYYKALSKVNNITEVETSPLIDYVSVDSIIVYKTKNRYVKLFSRIIR